MRLASILSAVALLSAGLSHAATITFSGASVGGFQGPVTESGYTYQTVSGSLFSSPFGNPGNDMEGQISNNGGALGITAVSGDFTFAQLDFADEDAAETITVSGYLNGTLVGVDTFSLPEQSFNDGLTWTTETANVLAGQVLDDLVITLPAQSSVEGAAAIDNVVLDATAASTPEPSSLVLLGSGLLGVATQLGRRKRAL